MGFEGGGVRRDGRDGRDGRVRRTTRFEFLTKVLGRSNQKYLIRIQKSAVSEYLLRALLLSSVP